MEVGLPTLVNRNSSVFFGGVSVASTDQHPAAADILSVMEAANLFLSRFEAFKIADACAMCLMNRTVGGLPTAA